MLYKILSADARSCHGGTMDWSDYLPRYVYTKECLTKPCPLKRRGRFHFDACSGCKHEGTWKPGKWLKHKGALSICQSGIHLTSAPLKWWKNDSRIFQAEFSGSYIHEAEFANKHVFSQVRLIKECGRGDLSSQVAIFKSIGQNADLRNADLRNADLRNADLWNADLRNADLRNANLWNANLWNADLRNADLRNANLRNANLRNAYLWNANLWNANLWNADLRNAKILKDPEIEGWGFKNGRLWRADS
jgi:hypothetical protein